MFSRKSFAACVSAVLLSVVFPCQTYSDADAQNKQQDVEKLLFTVVDLKLGEARKVELPDGTTAEVRLLDVKSDRDSVLNMINDSRATVEVNGETIVLHSGNYRLPAAVGGVQIDCPVTGDYPGEKVREFWNLAGDARLRVWPGDSPWIAPGTFTYPLRQRWMGAMTWFSNEQMSYAGGWYYYHAGMDFGATEGMTEALSAIDGVVASCGLDAMPGCEPPVEKRADVVYLKDRRGWFYRYSHLKEIDAAMRVGAKVVQGQRVGLVGKEGASGGWSHLHFDVRALQPSGKWGVQDSYAFLWQAYRDQYKPKVIAVARPIHRAKTGEKIALDATRSWAESGVKSYLWRLSDGTTADGPTVQRVYDRPGTYSEVVKVTANDGRFDYDFAQVRVHDAESNELELGIDANYHPSLGVRTGDEVTFSCRGFRDGPSKDTWDFGDGTPPVAVASNLDNSQHAPDGYSFTTHRFARPGDYIVTASTSDALGRTATRRLHVRVRE
ncbi:MAG: PKD domain-containing protein [Pirellulales bacterium]|nr:PKD domain-containing protein [Pirellulales bacterium]